MKIRTTKKPLLLFFIFQLTTLVGLAQDEPKKQRWQDRLPISLSGNVQYVSDEFVEKHWHSLRLHPRFSQNPTLNPGDGDFYPSVKEFAREKLFESEQAEELKKAIVEENVEEMKRLIKAGVDVNEVGFAGFTALHLAFLLDTNPEPFEILLENGADPTINLQHNLAGIRLPNGKMLPYFTLGKAVAHFAAISKYNRLFSEIFKNNKHVCEARAVDLERTRPYQWPFQFYPFTKDSVERLKIFVDAGVSVDAIVNLNLKRYVGRILHSSDKTARRTTSDFVKAAIEAGADSSSWWSTMRSLTGNQRARAQFYFQLIHLFALKAIEDPDAFLANEEAKDLLQVIEKKSRRTLEEAKKDISRWKEWQRQGMGELIRIEHKMRLKDSTGEALKHWRENGLKAKISEILKTMG